MNVLAVDDYEETPESLKLLLELHGHRCTPAHSSEEALKLINEEHGRESCFDAIIVDHLLPGMNGVDLIKEIRKVCCNPGAVILLTSAVDAYSADRLRAEVADCPRVGFIRKPFTVEELFAEIREVNDTPGT
jgi:CheY-like chemotaxis protein